MENTSLTPPPAEATPAAAAPVEPAIDPTVLAQEAQETLASMLQLLSFETKMAPLIEKNCVRIKLECEDAGRLIGRRGSMINEIQFLLNRILQRRHKNISRIFLDVDRKDEPAKEEAPAPQPRQERQERSRPQREERPRYVERTNGNSRSSAREEEPISYREPVQTFRREEPSTPEVEETEPDQPTHNELSKRARGLASQVQRWGEPADLGLLNAEDCKTVHEMFSKDREIEVIEVNSKVDAAGMQRIRLQLKSK